MPDPAPKPASKRRRANKGASYGAAEPVTAPAAHVQERALGMDDPHPLVVDMWNTVQSSCESRFYSEADWGRLCFELWFANRAMRSGRPTSGHTWAVVQHGLTELLISPAAKRRAAIELQAGWPDPDEVAAVSMVGSYHSMLRPVDWSQFTFSTRCVPASQAPTAATGDSGTSSYVLTLTTDADYIPEQETENPLPEPVAPTAPTTNVVWLHRVESG